MDDDLRPVPRREILFDVEQALRLAERLWPRKRVPGDHDRFRLVAQRIVEQLEHCGIRCFRKPPSIGHSIPPGPRPSGEPGMRVASVLMSAASLAVTALGGGPALEE